MKPPAQVVFGMLIAVLVPGTAFGQSQSRDPVRSVRISGRVLDAIGTPIRDVAVKLNLAGSTGTTASAKTSDTGAFNLLAAAPRSYELHFYSPGFKQSVKALFIDGDTDVGDIMLPVANIGGVMVEPWGDASPRVEAHLSETPGTLAGITEGQARSGSLHKLQPDNSAPIGTTLCELVRTPESFNGKIVRFRAEYVSKFQWEGFLDDNCSAKVPVGVYHVLDDLKPEQGQYAFSTAGDDHTHPERLTWKPIELPRPVQLKENGDYRSFRKFAGTKFRWPDGGACLDCPLYRINVTATGRFDYFEKQTVAVRANPSAKAFGHSAGDSNDALMRLVLESVSDVAAIPLDPAVYTESKPREITLQEAHDLVTAFDARPWSDEITRLLPRRVH
jgi:hypothetical protein